MNGFVVWVGNASVGGLFNERKALLICIGGSFFFYFAFFFLPRLTAISWFLRTQANFPFLPRSHLRSVYIRFNLVTYVDRIVHIHYIVLNKKNTPSTQQKTLLFILAVIFLHIFTHICILVHIVARFKHLKNK